MNADEANEVALAYAKAKLDGTHIALPVDSGSLLLVLDALAEAYVKRAMKTVLFEAELEFTRQLAETLFGSEDIVTTTLAHLVEQADRILFGG